MDKNKCHESTIGIDATTWSEIVWFLCYVLNSRVLHRIENVMYDPIKGFTRHIHSLHNIERAVFGIQVNKLMFIFRMFASVELLSLVRTENVPMILSSIARERSTILKRIKHKRMKHKRNFFQSI